MILAPLVGTALIVAVATDPLSDPTVEANLSAQQKVAATEPLVRSATECIVRAVVADPRYAKPKAHLGDLIVESMPSCVAPGTRDDRRLRPLLRRRHRRGLLHGPLSRRAAQGSHRAGEKRDAVADMPALPSGDGGARRSMRRE